MKKEKSNGGQVLGQIFLGFIHIHILHLAKEMQIFSAWMLEQLREHGRIGNALSDSSF